MKKNLKRLAQSLLLVPAVVLGVSFVTPAIAGAACDSTQGGANLSLKNGADCAQGEGQQSSLFGDGGIFTTIVNILLFLIGAIAVIMLIVGGIRYVISGGDANQVTAAKNTILYAVVGIVVAILAYAAVNFVIGSLKTD